MSHSEDYALPPGSTIGMLGGGQLGRMAALAAAQLGYRVHVFAPDAGSPCAQVSSDETVAGFTDFAALDAFAAAVDVVTLEFENVPIETLRYLEARVPVRPGAKALAVAQDRVAEKLCAGELDIETAVWWPVTSERELETALSEIGTPAVLKAARFGYDGKGQARIDSADMAAAAWQSLGTDSAILEGFVAFEREVSLVAARGADGSTAFFPLVENRHSDHILRETIAPASDSADLLDQAQGIAEALLKTLDYIGVLGIEFFETRDGTLLLNEIAPRPHNSGHWTIEGAETSQFEQQIRAVCGLPLGIVEPVRPARMRNLLGDETRGWRLYLADPRAHLHLYGKSEARPGRKMGHVTWLLG